MFKGGSNNSKMSTANLDAPDRLNRIVEGTSIKGEIVAESNLRIDGTVEGTITTKGRLVIGVNGKVEGDIVCQNADIEGEVLGVIRVQELLSLKSSAKINGEIHTGKLHIEAGAEFSGTCTMGNKKDFQRATNSDKSNVTVEDILEEQHS